MKRWGSMGAFKVVFSRSTAMELNSRITLEWQWRKH
ncbi:hypothetical protein YSA_03686 [Pseudomonas putida ND6]|uniref:Uncharacterized protein n=1 Tax=Pseudomonas putida ND6 TaxID=231023 RepID=I3UTD7_PSEPU|nr:hypothetical protein YSA_03686 [Pseudomonas putida ND6]